MKKTPFKRIREKNIELRAMTQAFVDIASLLSCKPMMEDIKTSIIEALQWKGEYMMAMVDNDKLRVDMGKTIDEQVQKFTFNVGLENEKLKLEVDRLTKMVNTKDNETKIFKEKASINKKGFWDFMYKVCKLA